MKTKIICKKALTFILVFALVAVQMFSSSVFTQANTTEAGTLFATTDILTDDEWEEVYYKADTLEIRSNGNSTLFTGLEENSTYMLDFDMTVVDASSLLLVGLRSDASFTAGQYLQLGNIGVTQARVSSDYWSGSLYGSNSISDFAVGDVVAVKVIMNPTSVALYLNGTLVQLYDHVNNDGYKDSVAVSSVANGSLLFGHNGGGTGIDVSNIVLKKEPTEEGETPEDPDTPVEDTTEWSENILTNQEDLSLTDYSKKLLDVTLDKDTAYQLDDGKQNLFCGHNNTSSVNNCKQDHFRTTAMG